MSNLLMAILAAIPFQLGLISVFEANTNSGNSILPSVPFLLFEFLYINLLLMLFNLIPPDPLDGEKIAQYFFPPSWADVLDRIRPYSPVILIMLFFGLPILRLDVFGSIMRPAMDVLIGILLP
jgi:Zn-dependent protease